jgi:hypothetical protein
MSATRRLLLVSPHFPPDSTAASHRARLLVPHLPRWGWTPTVLTVDPRDYESALDPALASLLPPELEVVRCRALPVGLTRPIGFGDLGLRALPGLAAGCLRLLAKARFDAALVIVPPWYCALLAPLIHRHVPVVLDYIDPWVSNWGLTVGPNGVPDRRSRVSRALALRLEPLALRGVDAVSGVSAGTYESIWPRVPSLQGRPSAAIPYGFEPRDFAHLPPSTHPLAAGDLVYLGTMPPLGFDTLRALFDALALGRSRRPSLFARVRLRFFGTSGRTGDNLPRVVLPVAQAAGVADAVTEEPARLPYLEALSILRAATGLLLLGSSEPHYTASRLFPFLLAERPLLCVFHEASSVIAILERTARPPTARLVTYGPARPLSVESIYQELAALVEDPRCDPPPNLDAIADQSAAALAGRMAALLDTVVA